MLAHFNESCFARLISTFTVILWLSAVQNGSWNAIDNKFIFSFYTLNSLHACFYLSDKTLKLHEDGRWRNMIKTLKFKGIYIFVLPSALKHSVMDAIYHVACFMGLSYKFLCDCVRHIKCLQLWIMCSDSGITGCECVCEILKYVLQERAPYITDFSDTSSLLMDLFVSRCYFRPDPIKDILIRNIILVVLFDIACFRTLTLSKN